MTENPNDAFALIREAAELRLPLHFVKRADNQGEPCGCGYEDHFVQVNLYMDYSGTGAGPVLDMCVACALGQIKSDPDAVRLIEVPRGALVVNTQSESYQLGVDAANAVIDSNARLVDAILLDIERGPSVGDREAGLAHTLREYMEAKGE